MDRDRARIRVLGSLEIEVGGNVVPLAGSRQQALLALLAMHLGEAVSTARIADVLWEEDLPADPANAVQTVVSRMRRLLGSDAILTEAHGYRLQLPAERVDAVRFEQLCLAARTEPDPASAAETARLALALWRGRPYGPHADGFARPAAVRLTEMRTAAQELLADLALARGELHEAVTRASELHAEHPLRDGPVGTLMRGLHGLGRTAEALETFRRHRAALDDELGLTPSTALRDLETAILREDPAVGAPVGPARVGRSPAPPAVAANAPPARRDLPWRPSPMLGRAHVLSVVQDAATTTPLLTLVGPGGVGKTRLALEVAHRTRDAGTAAWWVDLVAVPPGEVVDKVADGVGLELARPDGRAAALASALQARSGLLCLDNAEHLLDELAVLVEQVTSVPSDLRLLVTSRERLGLDSETALVLPPLETHGSAEAPSAASRLFLTRWRRGLEPPDGATLATVDHLCRELDGLPLAIELAAAQASTLGLQEVTDRLESRLDLLSGGRRTADARHRSLRAVVDWSVQHLEPAEAALLSRLSVFPGRFSVAQVEAVCGDDLGPSTTALLSRLVEQSLVQTGPDGFWLLETIRAHAAERQSEDERLELAARHARDTCDRLQEQSVRLWSPAEGDASREVDAMTKDLTTAWRHTLEHDHELALRLVLTSTSYAYTRQRLDILRWSVTLLERAPELGDVPELLAAAASSSWSAGSLAEALELARRGIEAAGGPDRPPARPALDVCADISMFLGDHEEAEALYRAGGALADHPVEALMFETAALQARAYGPRWTDNSGVEALLERAYEAEVPSALAFALYAAAETWLNTDVDRAVATFERAAAVAEEAGSTLFMMISRGQSVSERTAYGPVPQVAAELVEMLDRWERLDNEPGVWSTVRDTVVVLARAEDWSPAAALHASVVAQADRTWRMPRLVARFEGAGAAITSRADGLHTALSRSEATRLARQALARAAGGGETRTTGR